MPRHALSVLSLTLLLALPAAQGARPRPPAAAPLVVSLDALLLAPETYHGKRVQISAWLSLSEENHALCPDEGTVATRSCLWVNVDNGPWSTDKDMERYKRRLEQWQTCANRRVTVTGRVDATDQGLLGLWGATLRDITDVLGDGCALNLRRP